MGTQGKGQTNLCIRVISWLEPHVLDAHLFEEDPHEAWMSDHQSIFSEYLQTIFSAR